jgi:hypothetical protein
MDTKVADASGSNKELAITEMPVQHEVTDMGKQDDTGAAIFGPGATAFSTFYTWRANGVFRNVRFTNTRVNANSRVLVNISEFSSDAQQRFIGGARMAVYNIAPFNGGFFAWVDIAWGSPLNVRFDVLVDP